MMLAVRPLVPFRTVAGTASIRTTNRSDCWSRAATAARPRASTAAAAAVMEGSVPSAACSRFVGSGMQSSNSLGRSNNNRAMTLRWRSESISHQSLKPRQRQQLPTYELRQRRSFCLTHPTNNQLKSSSRPSSGSSAETVSATSTPASTPSSSSLPPPPPSSPKVVVVPTMAGTGRPGDAIATGIGATGGGGSRYAENKSPVSWTMLFLVGVAAASAVAYYRIERERRLERAMGKIVSGEFQGEEGWAPTPNMAKRVFVKTQYGWFPKDDGWTAGKCFPPLFYTLWNECPILRRERALGNFERFSLLSSPTFWSDKVSTVGSCLCGCPSDMIGFG